VNTRSVDYEALPEIILSLDSSIRFCAITNKLAYISSKYRAGLRPLMNVEETEKYALSATIRHSTRKEWESKIGKVMFTITRYEQLIRVTVPLPDSHLLLLSVDAETKNVYELIQDKIIPLIDFRN
jgi:hypothetical protein